MLYCFLYFTVFCEACHVWTNTKYDNMVLHRSLIAGLDCHISRNFISDLNLLEQYYRHMIVWHNTIHTHQIGVVQK
jgi:hypothetical protein